MKKNSNSVIFIAFFLFGLVFFIIGIFLTVKIIKFHTIARETTGVITSITTDYDSDGDLHHRVYVRYSVDVKEYDGEYGFYHSGMIEGQSVKIYYDPGNPRYIKSKSSFVTGFAFMLFSAVFSSVGLIPLIIQKNRNVKKKRLIEYGDKVQATVKKVVTGNISVNDIQCQNIICEYTDRTSGNTYLFKSENLYRGLDKVSAGQPIQVYVDYTDYSKYHVDVEDLLTGIETDSGVIDYTKPD